MLLLTPDYRLTVGFMWYAPVGGCRCYPPMQIEKTFETVSEPETLKEGQWYWNSWDGELFVVADFEMGVTEEEDTVTIVTDWGNTELVHPSGLAVDFERIHPVEVTY